MAQLEKHAAGALIWPSIKPSHELDFDRGFDFFGVAMSFQVHVVAVYGARPGLIYLAE